MYQKLQLYNDNAFNSHNVYYYNMQSIYLYICIHLYIKEQTTKFTCYDDCLKIDIKVEIIRASVSVFKIFPER